MNMSKNAMFSIVIFALVVIYYAIYVDATSRTPKKISTTIVNVVNTVYNHQIDNSFFETISDYVDTAAPVVREEPISEVSTTTIVRSGITAKAYLIGNIQTGQIYAEYNSRLPLPIASMSKLLTAYVGVETMTPTTTITISKENTEVYPDQSNLKEGEIFTYDEILYPLLLNSSNVAAEAIASTYGRVQFLELMSSYAWEIGLPTSYFSDPSGLSPQNRSSALGFFELAKYIFEKKRMLYDVTKIVEKDTATTTEHGSHEFKNIHPFVKDSRFIGGKTGRTPEAGDTMLTILSIHEQPIAFIVLGSAYEKRKADTDILISNYEKVISGQD